MFNSVYIHFINLDRFFLTGNCTAGAGCRHRHDVKRLAEVQNAHSGTINAVILADGLIWTAGADTSLRSWRPMPAPDGGIHIEAAGAPVECGEPVTALFWDATRKALICGLKSGLIRVFTREPLGQLDLPGHTDAVHSLFVFQNVLLSASWDGSVRTWQGDQLSPGMVIDSSRVPVGSIRVMKIFGGKIWLGGVLGVCAIDLQSLQVALSIGCESPVMSVLEFSPTDSVIVATLNGTIRIIQQQTGLVVQTVQMAEIEAHYGLHQQHPAGGKGRGMGGHSNYSWSAKGKGTVNSITSSIVALEGMMLGNTGKPAVVIGDQSGTCKVLELPNLEFRGQWFAHSKGSDIRNIVNTNENNIFITTASDGCLAVWQWQV